MVDEEKIRKAVANRIKALIAANSWGGFVLEEEPEDPSQHRQPTKLYYNMWTVDIGDQDFNRVLMTNRKSERPSLIEYQWLHTVRYRLARPQADIPRSAVVLRMTTVLRDLIAWPSLEDASLGGRITSQIWSMPMVHTAIDEQIDDDAIYLAEMTIGYAQTESIVQR